MDGCHEGKESATSKNNRLSTAFWAGQLSAVSDGADASVVGGEDCKSATACKNADEFAWSIGTINWLTT